MESLALKNKTRPVVTRIKEGTKVLLRNPVRKKMDEHWL